MWHFFTMSTNFETPAYSTGEWAVLLVTRLLTATFLTAAVGAVENWVFERFFAPDLYSAGPALARGAFMLVLSFPFILLGLVVLGLPIAYALGSMRVENAITYALAGSASGALWGVTVLGAAPKTPGIVTCAFYGLVCALFWWWLRPRR